jgi:hypothetical protein
MWGKRKKRRAQLPRQLALGLLEDAMGRVQQWPEEEEDEPAVPYPEAAPDPGSAPPDLAGLRTADVPVDNSAGPEPRPDDDPPPVRQELPARRTGESTRHGTFG